MYLSSGLLVIKALISYLRTLVSEGQLLSLPNRWLEINGHIDLSIAVLTSQWLIFITFFSGVGVAVISFLLYYRLRGKGLNWRQQTTLGNIAGDEPTTDEKDLEGGEILHLEARLKEATLQLNRTIKLLSKISNELQRERFSQSQQKQIVREINMHLTSDLYEQVDHEFITQNRDFFKKLSTRFPKLNSNDLRLCAYVRMNMSNQEIANIQVKSVDSVKVAKHRLRRKLDLNTKDGNLVTFLNRL